MSTKIKRNVKEKSEKLIKHFRKCLVSRYKQIVIVAAAVVIIIVIAQILDSPSSGRL